MTPITLTAYAQRRSVSVKAVSKAVASGRLSKSVVRDKHGMPKIGDVELADREWVENTRMSIGRPPEPTHSPEQRTAPENAESYEQDIDEWDADREYKAARARREIEAARREASLADMAEIEVGERRGELVPVDEARATVIDKFTVVKTRILGVPSRLAQRLPHVAAEVVPVIDALLREALEELAVDGDGD